MFAVVPESLSKVWYSVADSKGSNLVFDSLSQYRVGTLSCFDFFVERVIPP